MTALVRHVALADGVARHATHFYLSKGCNFFILALLRNFFTNKPLGKTFSISRPDGRAAGWLAP
jgi:hypothetical protein